MAKTKGPDWNPRTLSTFSTFGGSSPPVDGVNGDRSDEEEPESPQPLVNGEPKGPNPSPKLAQHRKVPHTNGHQTRPRVERVSKGLCPATANGYSPSHAAPHAAPHAALRRTGGSSPVDRKKLKHGVEFRKNSPKMGSPSPIAMKMRRHYTDELIRSGEASNRSSSSSGSSGGSVPEVLTRPNIVLPFYKTPGDDPRRDEPPYVARGKGTKVAPPIVPRHAYSKSLAGEEMGDMGVLVPRHAHSRSIGEEHLHGTNNASQFKNGFGEVCLFLGPADRRFGFSVVGGSDERGTPRIDEIAKGSPADKADLEVGDEILEVNGKSLEDATHTEVISHIHQCIRSRTICLRVKRRTGNKLAADLAASSNVQDAFVIAVEQRARERLERLSALKKIKPVDMTKLSTQLSESQQQPGSHRSPPAPEASDNPPCEDANGLPDSSPIYVTSVPNLTSSSSGPSQRSPSRTRSRSSTPGHRSQSPQSSPRREGLTTSSSSDTAAPPIRKKAAQPRGPAPEGDKSGDELELTHDLDRDDEELESESGDSLPATPEKTYGLGAPPPRETHREVLLDSKPHVGDRPRSPLQYTESLESKNSSSSRKSGGSGSSSGGTAPSRPLTSRGSSSYPDRGFKGESEGSDDPQETMISMVEFDPANKEMAVDVPDTFIGRTKTPPRYPPPKHVPSGYPSSISNNNNNSSSSKGSSKRGTSLSSGTVTPVNGTLSKPVSPPVVPEQHMRQDVLVHSPNSQEEVNKIKRYEEEIKQRREREEEMVELQRSSIRGSQKLQSLASYPQSQSHVQSPDGTQMSPTGVVNEAYHQEDLADDSENKGSQPSINELIQSLQRIQSVLKSNGHRISEDMNLVAQLLVNPEFQKVLAVHNKVQETWCLNRPPTPLTFKAQDLVAECMDVLNGSTAPEALELVEVLSKYPVEGLFYAHDRIADSEPPLEAAGIEQSVDAPPEEVVVERETTTTTSYPEENVRIVRIDKTNEPLGATIRNEGDAVVIGRIVQGGAAEKSGRLHEGDEILEVNGVEVRGKSVNDVCDMLAGMTGTLTFIISPNTQLPVVAPSPPVHAMHVKAYFDYDPEEDLYIPCRELGMSFQKGDILHVMNQQDPNWWQAYRDGEEDQSLAGLIPSKSFQQQREAMRQTVVGDNSSSKEKSKKGKLLCAKKHQKKKKKKMLYPNYNEDYDVEEILTYEEVALYFPRANRKRPIVLIGPPNIGRHEIRKKLMEVTDKFVAAVPHTSRPKRDHEVDGQDYHFISRSQFDADILARKYVEYGEFEKAYYGTSLDAIRAVVSSGKICVLNLHPASVKMLKTADLMPYVVFIAPPSLEKLRQKKQKMGEPFKEDDLKETIQKAREMEDQHGHYFDLVLINQDVERTYQQLIHEINVLEREPQWVPAVWLANER